MTNAVNSITPLESTKLIGLDNEFDFLNDLFNAKKFPRSLLLNGNKGIGKSTLILHFINNLFANNYYDLKNKEINAESQIFKKINSHVFQNLIFLSSENIKKVRIEDIRELRNTIQKSSLNNMPRFIILDDIELINVNSINALLKTLEEPSGNNHFILINNNQNELIKTVSSRCMQINIFLKKNERIKIIDYLIKKNNLDSKTESIDNNISPGLFLKYNIICAENNINLNNDYFLNILKLFNLYKKNKDMIVINLLISLTDEYFYNLSKIKKQNIEIINNARLKIIGIINNFVKYNLNTNSTFNDIQTKFINV
ncbi:AAA family ATPase [Pelagibacteraceae bacterium]|nr:AAA family ATPase [Pelagibacteraceae bacterium]